jgi:Secretion system C-terminal sorting domain
MTDAYGAMVPVVEVVTTPTREPSGVCMERIVEKTYVTYRVKAGAVRPRSDEAVEAPAAESLLVWPNPASDLLRVRLGEAVRPAAPLTLIDLTGRVLYAHSASPGMMIEIPLRGLPDGIYLLRTETLRGVQTRKVIKKSK